MDAADLRRAAEWTGPWNAGARPSRTWCRTAASASCIGRRCSRPTGNWPDALAEAEQACRGWPIPRTRRSGSRSTSRASCTGCAASWTPPNGRTARRAGAGREPAPGFALLRLAQGDVAAASAAVRRLVEESRGRIDRPVLLAAAVEVHLAAGDAAAAADASRELTAIADRADAPPLLPGHRRPRPRRGAAGRGRRRARRCRCCGRRQARWRALAMPYDVARAGVRVALACRALGDEDAARLELDVACADVRTARRPPGPRPSRAHWPRRRPSAERPHRPGVRGAPAGGERAGPTGRSRPSS